MSNTGIWVTLAALGAYHGINPAMGWLFAVSRGMQERSRRGVIRSLIPIALGHELSIALVAGAALGASAFLDARALRIGGAALLLAFGIFRFVKPRAHPRWTTMRVNNRELTWWSFLMSTAHGAGFLVAPLIVGLGAAGGADKEHKEMSLIAQAPLSEGAVAIMLHVGAMLVVMSIVAVVVYEKLGVEVLRRAWLNTDQLWAAAFVLGAVITFVS